MNRRTISLILTTVGSIGVGITSWLAVRCSKKAETKETTKEKIIAYAPAIARGVGTVGCIVGSHHISAKEIAALTATCTYLTANRAKIEKTIKEKFGDDALTQVNNEVAQETLKNESKKTIKKEGQTVEETGYGNLLFVDMYLGRKFRSSLEHVEKAEHLLNNEFHNGNYVCMNDFYRYLGIEPSIAGDKFGWPADEDYYDYNLETPIEFDNIKSEDEDGELMYAIYINYGSEPCDYWLEI